MYEFELLAYDLAGTVLYRDAEGVMYLVYPPYDDPEEVSDEYLIRGVEAGNLHLPHPNEASFSDLSQLVAYVEAKCPKSTETTIRYAQQLLETAPDAWLEYCITVIGRSSQNANRKKSFYARLLKEVAYLLEMERVRQRADWVLQLEHVRKVLLVHETTMHA